MRAFWGPLVVPLILIAAIAVAFGVPLSCSDFSLDGYNRYVSSAPPPSTNFQQIFCLANSNQKTYRGFIVQGLIALLGISVGGFCALIAGDAYYKLISGKGGFSVALAELFLGMPAPSTGRGTPGRVKAVLYHEPRDAGFRWKLVLIAGILGTPLIVNVVNPLATLAYNDKMVRIVEFYVNVTGIPNWITAENMAKHGWKPMEDDKLRNADIVESSFDPKLVSSMQTKLWTVNNVSTENRTPSGYEGYSLFDFKTDTSIDVRGQGSGLQTVQLSIPQASAPRNLGIIPLDNILLTPPIENPSQPTKIPSNTSDFTIEQSVLVFNQTCAAFDGPTLCNTRNDSIGCQTDGVDPERPPANPFWDYNVLALATAKPYDVFSQEDVELFSKAINGTEWKLWGIKNFTMEGGHYYNETSLPRLAYYSSYWSGSKGTSEEAFVMYTASQYAWIGDTFAQPYVGLLCKTALFPIAYNATIPAGTSSTRAILQNYRRVPFTAASRQLVEQAINLTTTAVNAIHANDTSYRKNQQMEMALLVSPCESLASNMGPMYRLWGSQVTQSSTSESFDGHGRPIIKSYAQDTCLTTEIDRLFKAHLSYLSFIPSDTHPRQWGWGQEQTRFVPDKLWCGAMLALMVLLAVAVIVLRWLTLLSPDEYGSVDATAPWAAELVKMDVEAEQQPLCILEYDAATAEFNVQKPGGDAGTKMAV